MADYWPELLKDGQRLLAAHWELDWVFVKRLGRFMARKPWFLKRKYRWWAFYKGLIKEPSLPPWFRKKRKRKIIGRHRVSAAFGRYREVNPNLEPNFMGNKLLGNKPLGGPPLGTIFSYTNGSLVTTKKWYRTGDPPGSLSSMRCWDSLNPGPPYRSGGPFAKLEMRIPSSEAKGPFTVTDEGKSGLPGTYNRYTGKFLDDGNWGSDSISNYLSSSVPTLSGYDTLAWDKTKPRVSKASLSQFIYELKDLPGQLETSANLLNNSWRAFGGGYSSIIMHPRSVADNYLNHEFGWAPFLGDLSSLYDLTVACAKYIEQTVRDNNTWIRRRAVLEDSDTHLLLNRFYSGGVDNFGEDLNQMCRSQVVDGVTCKATCDLRQRVRTRVWAEGAFKYYRPEFDDRLLYFGSQFANIQRLMTLYGLRINPTVIWKLTPWSWLVDWCTHVGDFIQHHDEFVEDGITSKYLYVMRSMERSVTKTCVLNFYSGPVSMSWQRSFSQKQRKVADSPYGFDRPWPTLSPRQLAILGAIGTTRSDSGFVSRGA